MKIKEVCAKTGLTDRAVRFYIDNELIHPAFTENYAGRKAYNFSVDDAEILKQIATLRRYDFSVEEIKYLLTPEGDVQLVLEEHIATLKEKSQRNIENIENLIDSLNSSPWTPQELCSSLNQSSLKPNIINDEDFEQKENKKNEKRDLALIIISAVIMAVCFIVSIIITKSGALNNVILNYIFAIEAFCGFLLMNYSFTKIKPKYRFSIYIIVVLVIYIVGSLSIYIN